MELRVVYESPKYTTGGAVLALDDEGQWWERRARERRWRRVRQRHNSKPLRAGRMGSPWFGQHRGPWVSASGLSTAGDCRGQEEDEA